MPAPRSGIVPDPYVLGAGDLVHLQLLAPESRDLGGQFEILDDGSARLALLGSVVLEGLTLEQASQWLRTLYARQLQDPQLELRILRSRTASRSPAGIGTGTSPGTPSSDWSPALLPIDSGSDRFPPTSPQRLPFSP